MAMILITHDLGVVAGRADRVAVMYAGQVVETADTDVLFRNVQHPYTEALLDSIPRIEHASHTRLDAIAGRPPDMVHPPPGCRFAPRCRYAQETLHRPSCRALVPADEPDHLYRCFFPVGTPSRRRPLRRRNLQVGQTGAGLDLTAQAVS